MIVEIRGSELPGLSCSAPDGGTYDNIHVGIGRPPKTTGLVRGDAAEALWEVDVRVRVDDEGTLDFGGPAVYGPKGDRSIGLPWGTVASDGTFEMFRAAKLRLVDVDPALVRRAERGGRLVGRVCLTDECGMPRCARVYPPHLTWSYAL